MLPAKGIILPAESVVIINIEIVCGNDFDTKNEYNLPKYWAKSIYINILEKN